MLRLARETDEHKKSLQQAAIRAQIPVDARSHRLQSIRLQHDEKLLGNKKCTWRSWQQQRKSLPNFGLIGLRPLRGRLRLRLLDC